jgi:non-canonical (house-cleaning) NTP pyrophosphatase
MKPVIKTLGLLVFMTSLTFSAENPYHAQYGYAKIVDAQMAYPDFVVRPVDEPVPFEIQVVVASDKPVKIEAVKALFAQNKRFKYTTISYDALKVSSGIAEQPTGIQNGCLGAVNRVMAAYNTFRCKDSENIYYCAIENYFECAPAAAPRDQGYVVDAPRDHAYVVVLNPQGHFFQSVSNGITVHPDAFDAATRDAECTDTGFSKTVGAYLQEQYGFDGGDWFVNVLPPDTPMNREAQILTTLDQWGDWF